MYVCERRVFAIQILLGFNVPQTSTKSGVKDKVLIVFIYICFWRLFGVCCVCFRAGKALAELEICKLFEFCAPLK